MTGDKLDRAYDFWVEGWTTGRKEGIVLMDGEQLKSVTKVDTHMEVDGITTVTITFVARSLNKGERPRMPWEESA